MASDEIIDLEVARLKMKIWRDTGCRNSDEIIYLGECLILDHANKLGNELWLLYEQVCIAAFDCNRMDLAVTCLRALDKQFPSSNRVFKLKAMRKEVLGHYNDAKQIYEHMLVEDPANMQIRKRMIALTKAQNDIDGTIKELNAYLKEFMGDQEAWMELSELFISQQEFSKAAFCVEELILTHPHNHLYHQRYADIHYTMNTSDSMEKARKYYAQALKLDPNNVRALYGLYLASNACGSKKDLAKMGQWSVEQIVEMIDLNSNDNQKKSLTNMFDLMSLAIAN